MRQIWLLGLTGCFMGSVSSTSEGGSRTDRSMAFAVAAGAPFELIEPTNGGGEFTELAADGSPDEITVTITEAEEVRMTGTLRPGTVEFGLEIRHVWDGPTDVEFWTVSITAN